MVGFCEVHGKGRVRGLEGEAQRWDEVTFDRFSTAKSIPREERNLFSDRTDRNHLPPSTAASMHHSQELGVWMSRPEGGHRNGTFP